MSKSYGRVVTLLLLWGWWNICAAQLPVGVSKYIQCPNVNQDPILQKGKRFFHSVTGKYFPIKGIAYYPRPNTGPLSKSNSVDFFTEEYRDLWEADIPYFKALGVNVIRIYAVDPSKNHDAFMCALQEAGIYVMIDLLADCEDCGIGPDEAPSCYPPSLKERGQWIINEFSKYTNTLVFSAGNEVTLHARDRQIELNAPCQKKFLRDMRAYVNTCSAIPTSILPRKVPIGMVNWDNERGMQARYFNCRTDPSDTMENAEWYGLNSYQHCDPTAVTVDDLVGWIELRDNFKSFDLSVPVIISEYGCRERFPTIGDFEAQRNWLQVDALYSQSYLEQFAGGVVFEFSAEKVIVDTSDQGYPWPYYGFMKLNYGVGYYGPIDCDHQDVPCEYEPYPEFDVLSGKLAKVNTFFMPDIDTYNETGTMPECPDSLAPLSDFTWPTDQVEDLPCYLIATPVPTMQPTVPPPPTPQGTLSQASQPGQSGALPSFAGGPVLFLLLVAVACSVNAWM
jgi:1,3-beta-glucanosyltransferase GAS5